MNQARTLKVLAISGSLRKESLNTALLHAAQDLAPEGMLIDIYGDLAVIPPYDDDVRSAGYPAPVDALRESVRTSDALIFATPEYNRSFSGVLKNAIDWVSRPPEQPFNGKPALVIGAGPGALGTALANYQLRQVLSILNVYVLPGAELLIGAAAAKFNDQGKLTDEATRNYLTKSLIDLRTFSGQLS